MSAQVHVRCTFMIITDTLLGSLHCFVSFFTSKVNGSDVLQDPIVTCMNMAEHFLCFLVIHNNLAQETKNVFLLSAN